MPPAAGREPGEGRARLSPRSPRRPSLAAPRPPSASCAPWRRRRLLAAPRAAASCARRPSAAPSPAPWPAGGAAGAGLGVGGAASAAARAHRRHAAAAGPGAPPRLTVITALGASCSGGSATIQISTTGSTTACSRADKPIRDQRPPRALRALDEDGRDRVHVSRYRSPGNFRDDADFLDAGVLQPVHHLEQVLQLDAAVAAQEDFLAGLVQQRLPHPLLEDVHANRVVVDIDDAGLPIAEGHGDEEPLADERRGPARHRDVDVDPALHHGRGHHEDDQQHEHDVHQRHDVDFRQLGRHPAAAATTRPLLGFERFDFGHRAARS